MRRLLLRLWTPLSLHLLLRIKLLNHEGSLLLSFLLGCGGPPSFLILRAAALSGRWRLNRNLPPALGPALGEANAPALSGGNERLALLFTDSGSAPLGHGPLVQDVDIRVLVGALADPPCDVVVNRISALLALREEPVSGARIVAAARARPRTAGVLQETPCRRIDPVAVIDVLPLARVVLPLCLSLLQALVNVLVNRGGTRAGLEREAVSPAELSLRCPASIRVAHAAPALAAFLGVLRDERGGFYCWRRRCSSFAR